jgi:hypothetical protein
MLQDQDESIHGRSAEVLRVKSNLNVSVFVNELHKPVNTIKDT